MILIMYVNHNINDDNYDKDIYYYLLIYICQVFHVGSKNEMICISFNSINYDHQHY